MAPYPKITTFPPLGKLSIIPSSQEVIPIVVLIEWNVVRPAYPFEFSVCYTSVSTMDGKPPSHPSRWHVQNLTKVHETATPYLLSPVDAQRLTFEGRLTRDELLKARENRRNHFQFTVKYRINHSAPWAWTTTSTGVTPGEFVLQEDIPVAQGIARQGDETQLLTSLLQFSPSDSWNITPLPISTSALPSSSEKAATHIFRLTSAASIPQLPASETTPDPNASLSTSSLGLISSQIRTFSVVRLEPYWLGPRQSKGGMYQFRLDEDALVVSFLTESGVIVTFVVPGWLDDTYSVFRTENVDDGVNLMVAARNDSRKERPFEVVASVSLDFHDGLKRAMDAVRELAEKSRQVGELEEKTQGIVQGLQGRELDIAGTTTEEWFDNLAFCTWNALGQDLTEQKILGAMEQLKAAGVNISTLLIDDNWQTLAPASLDFSDPFYRGWDRFEGNKDACPNGMKGLVEKIRKQFPGVRDIGVWHALMGYWGGIATDSQITRDYKTRQIESRLMGNTPAKVTCIDNVDLHKMYDDFYQWLASCGLTFVKTDVQHMLSEILTSSDREALVSTFQSAWTTAHTKHFGGKAISCMSQIPQTMFFSLLQTKTPRILLRNSDDFYPEVMASHPWHLWVNAHNALFTQHLNVLPDWDMFQTSHEYSAYHGAARCVSGGPILITDVPGEHDAVLIDQMTAMSPDGRTIALRPAMGTTIDAFDDYNEGHVLKIRTATSTNVGLLGLFNVSDREVNFLLSTSEFAEFSSHDAKVLVRAHRTGTMFGPLSAANGIDKSVASSLIYVSLPVRGYDIFAAHPIQTVQTQKGELSLSVLGLMDKMSGAAAVTASSVQPADGKISIQVSLKALGKLGVWLSGDSLSDKVSATLQGSTLSSTHVNLVAQTVGSMKPDFGTSVVPQVLEFDLLSAWKENNRWGEARKQVQVEVTIG